MYPLFGSMKNGSVNLLKFIYNSISFLQAFKQISYILKKKTRIFDHSKKMAACRFYRDPLQAYIIFNNSHEKFDLSIYVLVDNNYSRLF